MMAVSTAPWWFDYEYMCTEVTRGVHGEGADTLVIKSKDSPAQVTIWPLTIPKTSKWVVEYISKYGETRHLDLPRNVLAVTLGTEIARNLNDQTLCNLYGATKAFPGLIIKTGTYVALPGPRDVGDRAWVNKAVSIYASLHVRSEVQEFLSQYT